MTDKLKELEAIIFLSENALSIEELCEFFELEIFEMKEQVLELQKELENSGINVSFKNNMVKLKTNPNCGEAISNFFNPTTKVRKLSKSSMETLTIIAFKGPITKTEIEELKGMSVDGSIQVLLEKKLIHSPNRKKSVGNPKLYEVTDEFYAYVGFDSKEELFALDKAKWLREFKGEIESENK